MIFWPYPLGRRLSGFSLPSRSDKVTDGVVVWAHATWGDLSFLSSLACYSSCGVLLDLPAFGLSDSTGIEKLMESSIVAPEWSVREEVGSASVAHLQGLEMVLPL